MKHGAHRQFPAYEDPRDQSTPRRAARWIVVRAGILMGLSLAALGGASAGRLVQQSIGRFQSASDPGVAYAQPASPLPSLPIDPPAGLAPAAGLTPDALDPTTDATELAPGSPEEGIPIGDIPDPATSAPDLSPLERSGWTIQAGVFRNPANAEGLGDFLRLKDERVEVSLLPSGLYIVRMGPFTANTEAREMANWIQSDLGVEPLVLQTRN